MGSFYVNFATRGADQEAVVAFLRSAKRKAFASRTVDNVTIFFDEEADTQDESVIIAIAKQASSDLRAPVLAVVNHDDDILMYWLFEGGQCVDEYNSCPGYFTDGDTTPSGGDAKKLCAAFAVPIVVSEVANALRNEEFVFALDQHKELASLLKHPWPYVCLGYRDINEGSLAPGATRGDFVGSE